MDFMDKSFPWLYTTNGSDAASVSLMLAVTAQQIRAVNTVVWPVVTDWILIKIEAANNQVLDHLTYKLSQESSDGREPWL